MRTISSLDDLEFSQVCSLMNNAQLNFPLSTKQKKLLFNDLINSLPPYRDIISTEEISIGDTLVYTGTPRGTGMLVPHIGTTWKILTNEDYIQACIQIVERGRGWRPIL